jgi:hypothetical protein
VSENFQHFLAAQKTIKITLPSKNSLEITRYHHPAGETFYAIKSDKDKSRSLWGDIAFEKLLASLRGLNTSGLSDSNPLQNILDADGKLIFTLSKQAKGSTIYYRCEHEGSHFHFSSQDIPAFLASDKLAQLESGHTTLTQIVHYHRMFQKTFANNSESITSDLRMRAGFLTHEAVFYPKTIRHNLLLAPTGATPSADSEARKAPAQSLPKLPIKSRLGEREINADYAIDYNMLREANLASTAKAGAESGLIKQFANRVPISIPASEIRNGFRATKQSDHSIGELQLIREHFFDDREADFYLGMECCEAIYRKHGQLYSLSFPLYFTKVAIRESHKNLYLDPLDDNVVFFNFITLAYLIEQFSPASSVHHDLKTFLDSLSAQSFDVCGHQTGIRVSRPLPVDETYFKQVRAILFGDPGEMGKGGLFASLNILGVEIDLENTYLFRYKEPIQMQDWAIEADLTQIQSTSVHSPRAYSQSLLAQFLYGISKSSDEKPKRRREFYTSGYCSKNLGMVFNAATNHPVTVIEGPPGSGKTFNILNLFIDSLCKGRPLLIVSDRSSAIAAIREKIYGYLKDADDPANPLQSLRSSILILDDLGHHCQSPSSFANYLLKVLPEEENQTGQAVPSTDRAKLIQEIQDLDQQIDKTRQMTTRILKVRESAKHLNVHAIAAAKDIPTTQLEIEHLAQFASFLDQPFSWTDASGQSAEIPGYTLTYWIIQNRAQLKQEGYFDLLQSKYLDFLTAPESKTQAINQLVQIKTYLMHLASQKSLTQKQFDVLSGAYDIKVLKRDLLAAMTRQGISFEATGFRKLIMMFRSPLRSMIKRLIRIIDREIIVRSHYEKFPRGVWANFALIHHNLITDTSLSPSLPLEMAYHKITQSLAADTEAVSVIPLPEISTVLVKGRQLQNERDEKVKKLCGAVLKDQHRANTTPIAGANHPLSRCRYLLQMIKEQSSVAGCRLLLNDLQATLQAAFPVIICQKEVVSLLTACKENSFYLAIVDEATQCKVDDSLPILFRSKHFMVVGDDKQTVLDKDSTIDDYLFENFRLHRYLIASQGTSMKGGGSNVFRLAKHIKQGSIMLDEHFRCPPKVIAYSNHFVYENKLKIMQWSRNHDAKTVVVCGQESQFKGRDEKCQRGKFKGIETHMIDRFMDYVLDELKVIEKETGKAISLTDQVAICTFLIKNRPYFEEIKPAFLDRAKRGTDLLIGAGAELQGKERDYIFYFWDIYPGNVAAFRQGDDADKRKGELNVLMSRPKSRAYHYVHRDFSSLKPGSASIVDYLRQFGSDSSPETATQMKSTKKQSGVSLRERKKQPNPDLHPLNRGSGQLMQKLIEARLNSTDPQRQSSLDQFFSIQYSVAVGNPKYRVDLMIYPQFADDNGFALGIVDLAQFSVSGSRETEIYDYYFQLCRAQPKIEPVFVYLHEIADKSSSSCQRIMDYLKRNYELGKGRKPKTA